MGRAGPIDDAGNQFPTLIRENLDRLRPDRTSPGIVAVSGGADSVALLRALAERPPASSLVVAHMNHRLRGAESDADADFVAALFPQLPHRNITVDVQSAALGSNLEAVARRLRYEFLAQAAQEVGASWIATAHTLDDQAETVLHRLIRGTGLRGLRGIAESRLLAPGRQLIRPMLTVSRAEVIAYLQAVEQPWREDASNRDPTFTRNRIRHELLPLLRTFNPTVETSLARTADQAEEAYLEIESRVRAILGAVERPRAGAVVVLDAAGLAGATALTRRELLHSIWEREGWPRGDMTRELWQRAADVAVGYSPAWDLPGGIRIVGTARIIRIGPAADLPI